MKTKVRAESVLRLDPYRIIQERVESGAAYGLRRYWKHRDNPPSDAEIDAMALQITDAVMTEIWNVVQCED